MFLWGLTVEISPLRSSRLDCRVMPHTLECGAELEMKLRTNIALLVLIATPWFWNAAKLFSCDFKSNYRCEISHGIGVVVPPLSFVTVWLSTDGGIT